MPTASPYREPCVICTKPSPAWMADGSCAQTGIGVADIWHPAKGQAVGVAKAVCLRCPVIDLCREYAIADPSLMGTWGATSERERIRIRMAAATDGAA